MGCPVVTIITGIIAVADLRIIIGDPTLDEIEVGWMSNDMLCNIIQEHADALVEETDHIIGSLVMEGRSPGPPEVFEFVSFIDANSTNHPNIANAVVAATNYPWATFSYSIADGATLNFDPDFLRTVQTSPVGVVRNRFTLQDREIFWVPNNLAIEIYLPNLILLRNFHASGEMIRRTNESIKQDAFRTLQRRIAEGARQEGTLFETDRQLGELDEFIS